MVDLFIVYVDKRTVAGVFSSVNKAVDFIIEYGLDPKYRERLIEDWEISDGVYDYIIEQTVLDNP
jgi:hypothetical protein